jgi:CheY-like chemotaxis protein
VGTENKEQVILLVENDYSDVFMFRRAMDCAGFSGTVRAVTGVTDAVSYLTRSGAHTNPEQAPRPDVIVCDLKLCASTGTELLHWIHDHPEFRSIPVVMLSGSSLPADRLKARELGARAFFLKSGDIGEMTLCARAILAYLRDPNTGLLSACERLQEEKREALITASTGVDG